jgi:uncharacterized protein YqhQ
VMMRAPTSFAIVVRRRDGSLHVRERAATLPSGVARWPLVRGVMSLVESLRLGGEALRFSAEQAEADLVAEEGGAAASASAKTGALSALTALGYTLFLLATQDAEAAPTPADAPPPVPAAHASAPSATNKTGPALMLAVMVLFMIALPQLVAAIMNRVLHFNLEVQSPQFQAMTGVFKLTIVIGYMLLIRRVPDIRRVFQYHGAEHKTISTYEAGEDLTVENARKKTTLHPRCGTTFLVMVAIVSVLVFTVLGGLLPRIDTGSKILDNVLFFVAKLPFVPVLAAITFEIQRVFARYFTKGPLRVVLVPGFLVQKITTIEPDDDQLEIALASLRATLFRERATAGEAGQPGEAPPEVDDARFADYEAFYAADLLRSPAS